MKTYPMKFNVSAETTAGIASTWTGRAESTSEEVRVSIPPEFDGPGGGFSPEDLYALALENCFIATFKVFAEKSKLTYDKLSVNAELWVDRNEKGVPWMAKIELKVKLSGVSQNENAQRLLTKTSQSCMILNSVNTEKVFTFEVT